MTEDDQQSLRDLTTGQISHYALELGETMVEALLDNKASWRCGYDREHDQYWCTPFFVDVEERYPRGPGGRGPWVCKWGHAEFQALKALRRK
jgi:hypothetical protein